MSGSTMFVLFAVAVVACNGNVLRKDGIGVGQSIMDSIMSQRLGSLCTAPAECVLPVLCGNPGASCGSDGGVCCNPEDKTESSEQTENVANEETDSEETLTRSVGDPQGFGPQEQEIRRLPQDFAFTGFQAPSFSDFPQRQGANQFQEFQNFAPSEINASDVGNDAQGNEHSLGEELKPRSVHSGNYYGFGNSPNLPVRTPFGQSYNTGYNHGLGYGYGAQASGGYGYGSHGPRLSEYGAGYGNISPYSVNNVYAGGFGQFAPDYYGSQHDLSGLSVPGRDILHRFSYRQGCGVHHSPLFNVAPLNPYGPAGYGGPIGGYGSGYDQSYGQSYGYGRGLSNFGKYPWQAAVLGWTAAGYGLQCSATVIHRYLLLTSAHCLKGFAEPELKVILGSSDLLARNPLLPSLERAVVKIFVHEKYNFATFAHDVALVQVAEPIDFSRTPHVAPVCLPSTEQTFLTTKCKIVDYVDSAINYRSGGEQSTAIQASDMTFLSKDECHKKATQYGHFDTNQMTSEMHCITGNSADSCMGKSNGALICTANPTHHGCSGNSCPEHYFLAGIVSWSNGRCGRDALAVVTQLSPYIAWIDELLQSAGGLANFDPRSFGIYGAGLHGGIGGYSGGHSGGIGGYSGGHSGGIGGYGGGHSGGIGGYGGGHSGGIGGHGGIGGYSGGHGSGIGGHGGYGAGYGGGYSGGYGAGYGGGYGGHGTGYGAGYGAGYGGYGAGHGSGRYSGYGGYKGSSPYGGYGSQGYGRSYGGGYGGGYGYGSAGRRSYGHRN